MTTKPFNPAYTTGQTVAAAAVSASVAILADNESLVVTNTGLNIAYVRVSRDAASATTADYPVLPGSQISLTKGFEDDVFSYISAAGTSLHVITGKGL